MLSNIAERVSMLSILLIINNVMEISFQNRTFTSAGWYYEC